MKSLFLVSALVMSYESVAGKTLSTEPGQTDIIKHKKIKKYENNYNVKDSDDGDKWIQSLPAEVLVGKVFESGRDFEGSRVFKLYAELYEGEAQGIILQSPNFLNQYVPYEILSVTLSVEGLEKLYSDFITHYSQQIKAVENEEKLLKKEENSWFPKERIKKVRNSIASFLMPWHLDGQKNRLKDRLKKFQSLLDRQKEINRSLTKCIKGILQKVNELLSQGQDVNDRALHLKDIQSVLCDREHYLDNSKKKVSLQTEWVERFEERLLSEYKS